MTETASETLPPAPLAGLEAPHEPRPIRFIRREDGDGWRLKLYGITAVGNEPCAVPGRHT